MVMFHVNLPGCIVTILTNKKNLRFEICLVTSKSSACGVTLLCSLCQISVTHGDSRGFLPGGFNPFEKYARQNGNVPQIRVKIKDI